VGEVNENPMRQGKSKRGKRKEKKRKRKRKSLLLKVAVFLSKGKKTGF
jgi:hypothetical protein